MLKLLYLIQFYYLLKNQISFGVKNTVSLNFAWAYLTPSAKKLQLNLCLAPIKAQAQYYYYY